MRLVRTTCGVTFDNLATTYSSSTLVPGILCRATHEDERGARLVPVDYPNLAARVPRECYEIESPLRLLAEQAE
jgi:hypothetical protein